MCHVYRTVHQEIQKKPFHAENNLSCDKRVVEDMRFVDEAHITVESGKGGQGCISFRREAHVPRGGPDGGNGGRGADIRVRASSTLLTLYDFRLKRRYEAENGKPGEGRQRHGRNGKDCILNLPVGTLVYEVFADGSEELLADLFTEGEDIIIATGGRGGMGNEHFKSSTMRTPRFAQPGEDGQVKHLRLELKILAHAGLLGLPNAGKSTFLSRICSAKPKIAAYPFTTLVPNLGVLIHETGDHFVVADIPGLIEGAHLGQGLGHQFLRHVERTHFLIHILSTEEITLEDPWAGFDLLTEELTLYDSQLASKPQIYVVNKIDLWTPDQLQQLQQQAHDAKRTIFCISALEGTGTETLLRHLWKEWAQYA